MAVVATLGMTAAPADAAKRCGHMGSSLPDYYDVRAVNESCPQARRVVRAWSGAMTNVLEPVSVRGYSCKGARSKRKIKGVAAFKVSCRDDRKRVSFWIRPYH